VDFGYEIKADKLRLYYLNFEDLGLLICIGGMKKNQKKDIAQFKKLSKEISNQIKEYGQLSIKQS
jgi:putative component of toxin-antitoxin plasmid stabilization module